MIQLLMGFFIAAMIIVLVILIYLTIYASLEDVKDTLPLIIMILLVAGFIWSLVRLGTM